MTTRQRYGAYPQNIKDVETRLLRIETELSKRQPVHLITPGEDDRGIFYNTPPQITGLSLTPNIGTISVTWDASRANNLTYYEVQIANDLGFSSSTSFKTNDNFFTYQEGNASTRYYIRVRAVISSGKNIAVGLWSSPVNSLTGDVGNVNIQNNAVKVLAEERLTTVGSFPTLDNTNLGPETLTFGNLPLTTSGGVVSLKAIADYTGTLNIPTGLGFGIIFTYQVIRNPGNVVVGQSVNQLESTVANARFSVAGFVPFDNPPAGTHRYSSKATIVAKSLLGSAGNDITINSAIMQAIEIKR